VKWVRSGERRAGNARPTARVRRRALLVAALAALGAIGALAGPTSAQAATCTDNHPTSGFNFTCDFPMTSFTIDGGSAFQFSNWSMSAMPYWACHIRAHTLANLTGPLSCAYLGTMFGAPADSWPAGQPIQAKVILVQKGCFTGPYLEVPSIEHAHGGPQTTYSVTVCNSPEGLGGTTTTTTTTSVPATPVPTLRGHLRRRLVMRNGKVRLPIVMSAPGLARITLLQLKKAYRHSFALHSGANRVTLRLGHRFARGRYRFHLTLFSATGQQGRTYAATVNVR
jgi:hypothetical protein